MLRRRTGILWGITALLILGTGLLGGIFLLEKLWGDRALFSEENFEFSGWQSREDRDRLQAESEMHQEMCREEMSVITTAREAVVRGNQYFGGEKGHDLICAREAFIRSVSLDTQAELAAWHQLGRVNFIMDRPDDAIASLNNQLAYFGDQLPNVHYMLGLTYGYKARKSGDIEEWRLAEAEFQKYIALDPKGPWARVDLSWVYFAQGKFEEMKPILEEGLLENPHHPWLLNMYGLALMNTGEVLKARDSFETALTSAKKLSVRDWGKAYPGNDPEIWGRGLNEMLSSIKENITIADERLEHVDN